jgi:hypothetical protein
MVFLARICKKKMLAPELFLVLSAPDKVFFFFILRVKEGHNKANFYTLFFLSIMYLYLPVPG